MKIIVETSSGKVVCVCCGDLPLTVPNGCQKIEISGSNAKTIIDNKGARFLFQGGVISVSVPAPVSGPVPASVPLWAFRQILADDGLLATVQSAAASNPAVLNYLEYGNFVDRKSPTLAALAAQLGKTDAEVDAFFRRAARVRL